MNNTDIWQTVPSYNYDHQDTTYTCGPSSMCMALSELKINKSEQELARLMNTTQAGTCHEGFFQAMHSLGLNCYHQKFWEVGWERLAEHLKDPQIAVVVHGMCSGWSTYYKQYKGGHYVYPIAINLVQRRIRVADPSRGVIEYGFDEFRRGMDLVSQPSLIYIKR